MNLIGAMLIMLGCAAAGIMKAHGLGELDKTYSSLISALMLMKSEISSRASALDDVMNVARSSAAGDTARFIGTVIENFQYLARNHSAPYGQARRKAACKAYLNAHCQPSRSSAAALENMKAPCSARL